MRGRRGRAVTVDSVNLTYDALGRMVEQNRSGVYSQIVYAPGGDKLAIMNGQSLQKAFVPLVAGAQAVYTSAGLAYYRHPDWLGSARLASTAGQSVYYEGAYAPFGESYAEFGTPDRSFTGQNQDTVTGLYDFLFREYSPVQGRWVSPDPLGLGAVSTADPQSWNRYAYVGNTPLTAIDSLGLDFFSDAIGAWNRNIDLGWRAWVNYSTRETFRDHYYDLPGMADATEESRLTYLRQVNGANNVAVSTGGFTITFSVSFPYSCAATGYSVACMGLTYALFEFLDPTQTKTFSFETSFPQAVAAFERKDFFVSRVDNRLPIHKFNLRDPLPFCSLHVDLDPSSGPPTTGTVHIDSVNPINPLSPILSPIGHGLFDFAPWLLSLPKGSNLCQ